MANLTTPTILPPPFLNIDNLPNARDIGPLRTSNGHVKKGILFRGPDLTRLTPSGIEAFTALGIRTTFDLRSQQQLDRMGTGPCIAGVTRIWTPVFDEEGYTEERAGDRYRAYAGDGVEGIVGAFVEILISGKEAFRVIMQHLASLADEGEGGRGVYVNCTTGNNRTGPFVALLLSYLGVSDEDVAREYALSQIGLASSQEKTVMRLRSNSKFAASFPEEELEERARRMTGARGESMVALLGEVGRRWGGAEGYFGGVLGLDGEVLERVRRLLILEETQEMRQRRESLSRPVEALGLTRALSIVSSQAEQAGVADT